MLFKLSQRERKKMLTISTIVTLLLISWIVFGPTGALKYYKITKDLETFRIQNQELEEQNKALREEVDKLLNDPKYIEEIARKKYGLIKKNEIIFDFEKEKKRK